MAKKSKIMDAFIKSIDKKTDFEKLLNELTTLINVELDEEKRLIKSEVTLDDVFKGIKANNGNVTIGYTFDLKDAKYAFSLALYGGTRKKSSFIDREKLSKYQNLEGKEDDDKRYYYFKINNDWTLEETARYCANIIRDVVK